MNTTLPKEWKRAKIGDVSKVFSGATPKTGSDQYWNGNIVWVTPKDLSDLESKYIDDSARKITEQGLESSAATMIPANSLVMSSRAPIGYLAINKVPVATNQGCKTIVPGDAVDIEYLYYYIGKNIDDVKRLGAGSTFAEVGKAAVESVEIALPSIIEQRNIAKILHTVDEAIYATEAVISSAEKLKRALMQDLFTGGIGDKKRWVQVKLGELATISRGGSPRPIEDYITDEDDGLNWLKIGDIKQGAKYITHTNQKIKKEGLSKTTLVHSGDFILSNSMSFGRPYIMKIDACIHDGWLAFRDIKSELVTAEFLYYLLSSTVLQTAFSTVAAGSGVKNLKRESVSNIVVALPPTSEQEKIAEVLSAADAKISANRLHRDNLLTLKKGLMADLLSGKKRTI